MALSAVQSPWIAPFELNMDITRSIYEEKSKNCLLAMIQKIAICTVIPIALIAFFEGVVKNWIILNLVNAGIVVLNGIYSCWNR